MQDAPCLDVKEPHKYVQKNFGIIDEAYDRRTQFIHSRLVPMGSDDGLLFFNEEHLKKKNTEWTEQLVRPAYAADYYGSAWANILSDLGNLWSKLQQWLRDVDNGPFKFQSTQTPSRKKKTLKLLKRPSGFQPPSTTTLEWEEISIEEPAEIEIPDVGPSGIQ